MFNISWNRNRYGGRGVAAAQRENQPATSGIVGVVSKEETYKRRNTVNSRTASTCSHYSQAR